MPNSCLFSLKAAKVNANASIVCSQCVPPKSVQNESFAADEAPSPVSPFVKGPDPSAPCLVIGVGSDIIKPCVSSIHVHRVLFGRWRRWRAMFVQPDSSKTLSKWFIRRVVIPLHQWVVAEVGSVNRGKTSILSSGALGKSLTSGFQDHVQGPPPLCRPELEGVGKVMLCCYAAKECLLILQERVSILSDPSRNTVN